MSSFTLPWNDPLTTYTDGKLQEKMFAETWCFNKPAESLICNLLKK